MERTDSATRYQSWPGFLLLTCILLGRLGASQTSPTDPSCVSASVSAYPTYSAASTPDCPAVLIAWTLFDDNNKDIRCSSNRELTLALGGDPRDVFAPESNSLVAAEGRSVKLVVSEPEGKSNVGIVMDVCGECEPSDGEFQPVTRAIYRDDQDNQPNNLLQNTMLKVPCGGLVGDPAEL
ncbi:unnamed protein product, partial [Discosporangium mesarthrocarpum]